jgi:hypothetical protein
MHETSKLLLAVAIPTVTVLVGILVNNRQLDQLDRHMHQQIDSLRNELVAGLGRVEGVLTPLKQVE